MLMIAEIAEGIPRVESSELERLVLSYRNIYSYLYLRYKPAALPVYTTLLCYASLSDLRRGTKDL